MVPEKFVFYQFLFYPLDPHLALIHYVNGNEPIISVLIH